MSKRPRIKPELTVTDKILEATGWAVLTAMWIMTAVFYYELPDTIPTHFNSVGEADGFGSRTYIFHLPVIASVLFIGMAVLNRFPHLLNYPAKITEENALWQYKNMTRMVRFVQLALVILFGIIEFQTFRYAAGHAGGLGVWVLPFACIAIFGPIIYFTVKALK